MGEKKWCRVRRFRCTCCLKTFSQLPDFLIPYKHYVTREIENVLRALEGAEPCALMSSGAEESTLRRWRKEFHYKMQHWAGILEAKAQEWFQQCQNLMDIYVQPLQRLKQAVSLLPELPPRWPLLIQAIHWLSPSHPLCL